MYEEELAKATPDRGENVDQQRLMSVWEQSLAAAEVELTTPGLIEALQSPHLHIRVGAALLLGRRGEMSAISHLKSLLGDRIEAVRVEAAMSLALLGDRSGISVLAEAVNDELVTTAPITAASYLAVLGDPRGYKTVLKALNSNLTGIRLAAAVALKNFLPYKGKEIDGRKMNLFATLKKALNDPDSMVRRELLYKVAMLDDPRGSALLSKICDSDSDERVRQTAQYLLSSRSGSINPKVDGEM